MTPDQIAKLETLENAVFAPRQKGRIDTIRSNFHAYKTAIFEQKEPWYKRFFNPHLQRARRP